MSSLTPQHLAAAYQALIRDILCPVGIAADHAAEQPPLSELKIQELWETGIFGSEGETIGHGHVRILDFGEWNHGAGPDFLRAELELNGKRIRGDIEIDPAAQDWERHGHGANALYNRVALHVVLSEPPPGWYTRNSLHEEVPVLYLAPEHVRAALDISPPPDRETMHLCRRPLEEMDAALIQKLLEAAAAHRAACKRKRFHRKAQALGEKQAWFEAWAETLGYSANKNAMLTLARRAPLHALAGAAESILFGTAGFLVPVLPDKTTAEARLYHRHVWDSWWKQKEQFSLSRERAITWTFAGIRPLNHPHRRVATLALSALHWDKIAPLLRVNGARRLADLLTELHHPFWDYHCTLTSAPLRRRAALAGKERIADFLVNYIYVLDESPGVWEAYLKLKSAAEPAKVVRTARRLFGERDDISPLLRYNYARQGLLQIEADFCADTICRECLFPEQLKSFSL